MAMNILFKKRITNELRIINKEPLEYIDICPDEDNFKIWYFLIHGPPDTPYKDGWYIGKLVLTEGYPSTPVDFYMLTPNGRFQTDQKICLTISTYHSDSWSPAWTIQKILGAFLSVMVSDYDTGISHIKQSSTERRNLAAQSINYNVAIHPDIFAKFKRFVVSVSDTTAVMKTYEEISDELPKTPVKKTTENIDLSKLKIT